MRRRPGRERRWDTKRRIEITVERRRLVYAAGGRTPARAWCAACAGEVQMLSPEEAGLLAGVSARAIYRRVEGGEIHYEETPDGRLLVCAASV